jgi:hypothetical protein
MFVIPPNAVSVTEKRRRGIHREFLGRFCVIKDIMLKQERDPFTEHCPWRRGFDRHSNHPQVIRISVGLERGAKPLTLEEISR